MTRPARPLVRLGAGLAVLSVLAWGLSACSDALPPSGNPPPTMPSSSPTQQPSIGVPDDPLVLVAPSGSGDDVRLTQEGSASVDVSTSTDDSGRLRVEDDADGGPALRFPAFVPDDAAPYPRAVVVVTNAGDRDQFDPGGGRLEFGVDFDADARSTGRSDDNGNNLIQRGLSSDDALYKLEIDANMRPTCTVRGTQGTVIVRSTVTALPGEWYRARCIREGNTVDIKVGRVLPDGSAIPITSSGSGPIGIITMGEPGIPISIGGKVAHDGSVIDSASDQFNGLLRNPFVALPG